MLDAGDGLTDEVDILLCFMLKENLLLGPKKNRVFYNSYTSLSLPKNDLTGKRSRKWILLSCGSQVFFSWLRLASFTKADQWWKAHCGQPWIRRKPLNHCLALKSTPEPQWQDPLPEAIESQRQKGHWSSQNKEAKKQQKYTLKAKEMETPLSKELNL